MHRFTIGQEVISKSGTLYRIECLRSGDHRKLAGELGYNVIALRNGRLFGPVRIVRESALSAAPITADFSPCGAAA